MSYLFFGSKKITCISIEKALFLTKKINKN